MTAEDLEEIVERLYRADAPPSEMADAAMRLVESRIADDQAHLASLDATRYESSWDDGQKLGLIETFIARGMEQHAIILCHRWKLTRRLARRRHDLFRILFPKLPPHPNDKESPDDE